MIRRLRHRDEQGSTLIVALAFLSLFGVFIAAILAQVSTNMRLTSTTRLRTDRLMAADGGLEWGVQHGRAQDTACTNVGAGVQTLTSALTVDGRTVTVKCEALNGSTASPAAQQWAAIASNAFTTSGTGSTITGGDVWAGGTITTGAGSTLATSNGDVIKTTAGCASTGLTVEVPDTSTCSTAATPDVPHTLPALPANRTLGETKTCNGVDWKIWHPGTYKPGFTPDAGPRIYLESGLYYFEDIFLDLSGVTMIGGRAPDGESSVLGAECPVAPFINDTSATVPQATGRGVTIILGGFSTVRVQASSRLELYTRVPTAPAGDTAGVSIITIPTDNAVAGYKPWTPPAAAPVAALTVLGRTAIHGLVHARDDADNAQVYVTAQSTAPLLAGVITSTLVVNNPGAAGLKAVEANGRRILLLTSTAAPAASGEITAAQSAVVKIANDPTRTASVRSWRAQ